MESKRPYFLTKAAWAAARAAAARQDADAIDHVPSADWRGVQRRVVSQFELGPVPNWNTLL